MFNRGIEQLLEALPVFADLDSHAARRFLSRAYMESLAIRDSGDDPETALADALAHDLSRMAAALETHAILSPDVSQETVRACSFVAAESLSILDDLSRRDISTHAQQSGTRMVEAGLLYLIAGFDANAAVAARAVDVSAIEAAPEPVASAAAFAAGEIRRLLLLAEGPAVDPPAEDASAPLDLRIRAELWSQLGRAAGAHLDWLHLRGDDTEAVATGILDGLIAALVSDQAAGYSDLAHLGELIRLAVDESGGRALRRVDPPEGDDGGFAAYRTARARQRPLLWPAAKRYADDCLPGPHSHAVVAVPTGAGKSAVAELAAASALGRGWVLYLAPTNALVRQVRRDLRVALAPFPDVSVRTFLGGAELSGAVEETLADATDGEVLVMTPEKCSLALRQSPEAFASLALCVLDECHLIGERGTRGVLAELVLAHVLTIAPEARVLLMSALTSNPDELAHWLASVTAQASVEIREPWRPTRTLRAAVGFDREAVLARANDVAPLLAAREKRKNWSFRAPVAFLANLEGPWTDEDDDAYVLIRTRLEVPLQLAKHPDGSMAVTRAGYVNPTVGAVAGALAREGQRVLAFLPRSKHYSFSVGATVDARQDVEESVALGIEIEAQLDLADFELGLRSELRDLLSRRVAVHTSALLDSEQRASELAFSEDVAHVMFATGTLAQGLNLPATAVIVGGTTIGDPRGTPVAEQNRRIRSQLLNAFGRAGRARTAARSVALIVPDDLVVFDEQGAASDVLEAAPFLREEDAADAVRSQLSNLIDLALRGEIDERFMRVEDLAAFAVLPLGADADPGAIVRHTYAAWSRNASNEESSRVIAGALSRAGREFLGERPAWLIDAAYLAGLTVQQMLALHDAWLTTSEDREEQHTIDGWTKRLLRVLQGMRTAILRELIPEASVSGTTISSIHDDDDADDGWRALERGLLAWMAGATLERIAIEIVGADAGGNGSRNQQAPLPKVIRVVQDAFVFSLSRVAGGVVALHDIGVDEAPDQWSLAANESRSLGLVPLAIRNGCDDLNTVAWSRFGTPQRRLAHVFARHLPLPDELAEERVASWVRRAHNEWLESLSEDGWGDLDAGTREALMAWRRIVVAERYGLD